MRMREHTKQNDAHSILPLPDKTFSNARECMNGSTPSTGLVTVQVALRVCKAPVHLYGFYPHCCYDEGWARPVAGPQLQVLPHELLAMGLLRRRQGGHGERAALLWEDGGQGIGKGASAQAASSRGQRFQRGLRLSGCISRRQKGARCSCRQKALSTSGCQPDAMCGVPGSWPPVSWPAERSIR